MAAVNIREAYDLLQQVLQQQDLQRQGVGFDPSANGAPGYDGSNDDGGRGGLLGRLAALQAEQGQYQPGAGGVRQTPPQPRDPKFRQVSRAPISDRAQGASGGQPSTYADMGDGTSFDAPDTSPQYAGLFGNGNKPVPSWIAGSPSMPAIPVGWRGRAIPMPPMGPVPLPPIPELSVPDWLKEGQSMLQLFLEGMYGKGVGGDRALELCLKAAAGDTDDWENFCRFLARRPNKVSGGGSQNQACWHKAFDSRQEKENWCHNQFGRD